MPGMPQQRSEAADFIVGDEFGGQPRGELHLGTQ
jgi:hypothetical protein